MAKSRILRGIKKKNGDEEANTPRVSNDSNEFENANNHIDGSNTTPMNRARLLGEIELLSSSNDTSENVISSSDIISSKIDSMEIDGIIDDIEDYIKGTEYDDNSTPKVMLPPVLKFNKNWALSVTELSCQLWCEKQIEFQLITGRKRLTEAMESGTKRHEELELEDHEIIEVEIETNEDNLGIRFLNTIELINQLLNTKKCREMWLFSKFGYYTFSGIIDQLTINRDQYGNDIITISDTKTRSTKTLPSIAQMQGSALQVQVRFPEQTR